MEKALKLMLTAVLTVGVSVAQGPEVRDGKLKPGDPAMDFTLKIRHSEKTVTLSSYRGKQPVALVFGSYT
jgi:hypothetical protein